MSPSCRRAMWSQFLGFGMDAYDMAMVVVLAPVLSKTFGAPGLSSAGRFLMVAMLYAATAAARPLGALIFGHLADRMGRRTLLIVTMAGVGVLSAACALVPSPARIGLTAAFTLFMALRVVMGCFFGGEYAVGHAFAIEHAPAARRGAVGGFIQSGFPLGYAVASFVVLGASLLLGERAMQDYGWRLMFATGIAPVAFALYIRKSLDESPVFAAARDRDPAAAPPLLAVLRPPALRPFLQVFAFMTGLFLTDYAVYQFLPAILQGPGKFDLVRYTFIYGFALLCAFLGYNLYGRLSDRWGRRKMTMWYCLGVALLGVPLYKLLIYAASTRSLGLALAAAVLAACFKLAWGIVPAYLSEMFPTRTRSCGVGLGYSAGALVGGGCIVPLVGLLHGLPAVSAIEGGQELWLSASCALTLGAVITFLSLLGSPETKDVDLGAMNH